MRFILKMSKKYLGMRYSFFKGGSQNLRGFRFLPFRFPFLSLLHLHACFLLLSVINISVGLILYYDLSKAGM